MVTGYAVKYCNVFNRIKNLIYPLMPLTERADYEIFLPGFVRY